MADHGCSQLSQPVTCHVRFRTDSSRQVRFPAAQGAENVPTSECLDAQQMRSTSAVARCSAELAIQRVRPWFHRAGLDRRTRR
jgi:hypothetical protein